MDKFPNKTKEDAYVGKFRLASMVILVGTVFGYLVIRDLLVLPMGIGIFFFEKEISARFRNTTIEHHLYRWKLMSFDKKVLDNEDEYFG